MQSTLFDGGILRPQQVLGPAALSPVAFDTILPSLHIDNVVIKHPDTAALQMIFGITSTIFSLEKDTYLAVSFALWRVIERDSRWKRETVGLG